MPRMKKGSTPKQGTQAATKKKAAAKKAGKKKAQAKKKAAKANGSYGRKHALYDALKKGGTRDEVAAELNRLYVKHGGSDNPTNSRNWVATFVPILEHFGVVQRDDQGRFSLTKK